jgi:histidinol-phosphate aminotransferase
MDSRQNSSSQSRRSFLQWSVAVAAGAASCRIFTEPMLAHAQTRARMHSQPKDAVMINANENPLGPCDAARSAVSEMAAQGGRYSDWLTDELVNKFCELEGLKPEYVRFYPGSSEPLHYSVCAFTSPVKSYVTADPGYEAGMHAAEVSRARIVKVPLAKDYSHDVKAMLSAAPDAGLFYICTPNNPTGTLTSHSDVEFALAHKPKDSILLVDEAYIHFCDAPSVIDLVKANQDVILLRTFSKIYGMAGLRCGVAIARPDLLQKIATMGGWNAMPITALAAATASLHHTQLVPDRKRINTNVREQTFGWLDKNGYTYIRSESNCFLLDTKRPAKEAIEAMARQNVYIGRVWPVMPTYARITIGTQAEMERFQSAFQRMMNGSAVSFSLPSGKPSRTTRVNLDGLMVPL